MATFKAVILTGKKDIKEDGTTNIKIRITHLRKTNYISTEIYINPVQMDNKTGQVKGKNRSIINLRITDWLLRCRKIDMELGEGRNLLSAADIKAKVLNNSTSEQISDFFEFAEELIQKTKKSGTAEQYGYTVASLKKFAGGLLPFSEINLSFLQRYETFLLNRGVKNGVINYMTTFRALFNKARDYFNDEDLNIIKIPHYPFRKYKIPKRNIKSKDHVLTVEG